MPKRLNTSTASMMIITAGAIDLFGAIPFIGPLAAPIVDVCASFIFGLWFSHYGISVVAKRPVTFFGTIILEFIPGISMVPFWTLFVALTIAKERVKPTV